MAHMPTGLEKVLNAFRGLFTQPTWQKVQVLVMGTLLCTGKRTVTAALRVMGLGEQNSFAKFHQVLNRASWSPFKASQMLLGLVLKAFDGGGVLVFGLDETLERRWGKKIKAKGIYRDAVRSSHSHFVKCSGLRWMSLMLLTDIPWAKSVWALPILTALAPSERYCSEQGIRHKKLTDWARQIIILLRRWLPERDIVMVADSGYSALDLLHACQSLAKPVSFITRLRLDAALYTPAPERKPGQLGRPRLKGKRLPTLAKQLENSKTVWHSKSVNWYEGQEKSIQFTSSTALWYHAGKAPVPIRSVLIKDPQGQFRPQALLSTNLELDPAQIIEFFVLRWRLEVTFQEARLHLGVETNRSWSDLATRRTTPILFGLFTMVTLAAHNMFQHEAFLPRSTAWYSKTHLTFSDALANLRKQLWQPSILFDRSSSDHQIIKIPKPLFDRLVDTLAYPA